MAEWLGEFEQLVLFAVLHAEPNAYGVTVRQAIEERAGRSVSAGAVYTTLERLQSRGLLESSWGEPSPERGGKRKRFFTSSAAGRAALTRSWQSMQAMARGTAQKLGRS